MKGYPKTIATKRDFENLLTIPEYREKALADLQKIVDAKDSKTTISEGLERKDSKEIDNPMPLWKQKGFASLEAVSELVKKK